MGIIKKQSIKSSIFLFIGFGIGALNILVLFPKYLSPAQLGLTRAMIDISLTLSTLCTLGSIPVIYKFLPFYNERLPTDKNDLPFLTAVVCLVGFSLVLLSGFIFKDFIVRKLGKSPDFATYFYTVYPFTLLLLMFTWLEAFSWGLRKTVITNFLKETGVRILTTVLILFYGVGLISIKAFINFFSILYLLPALILFYVLYASGKWRFSITGISNVTRRLKSRMISFGSFVFASHFLNVLARTNDTILVIGLRGLADTGVFAIAGYIIAVMEIPQRSLNAISIPILAESWKNNDKKNIENVYKKSVANLLVVGLGLLGLILLNIHNITIFLGKNYAQIELIVFILGLARVIDLGTGINGLIIGTSNYWKFDFYTNVLYTLLSLPLNFFLIKYFGLKGLAISSLISLTIYNSFRFVFLYTKFNFQPYNWKSVISILIACATYLLVYFIPRSSNIFVDSAIKTFAFSVVFLSLIYACNVVPDMNGLVVSFKNKLLRVIKK